MCHKIDITIKKKEDIVKSLDDGNTILQVVKNDEQIS